MLEFFGHFVNDSSKAIVEPWTRRGMVRLADYRHVNVMPVANYQLERLVPKDISAVSTWRPRFEFPDSKDNDGDPYVFDCSGVTLEKRPEGVVTHVSPSIPNVCLSFFSVSDSFVGNIRIADRNFFLNGEKLFKKLNAKFATYIRN